MDLQEKQDRVMDKIQELDWSDSNIPEVMEGFFNNPLEAVERVEGDMSEEHINSLFELLGCKEDEEED